MLRAQYGFEGAEAEFLYSMGKRRTGMYCGSLSIASEAPNN